MLCCSQNVHVLARNWPTEYISGISLSTHADRDVKPYTKYQYSVKAINSAGDTTSDWSSLTRTGEAAPEQMPPPTFGQVTERSVQVIASEPAVANGIIRSYTVYARKNRTSLPFEEVRALM